MENLLDKKTIISIGREYGSGGRQIGFLLAEKLGIKCYDKEILSIAAKTSGICEEYFKTHEEKPTRSFLYSLVMGTYSANYINNSVIDMPLDQKIFLAEFDSIKNIAQKDSCIFIGRCADYVLEDMKNCVKIFITGNIKDKINRVSERMNISKEKAHDLIIKTDKKRASYYNFYTNKHWGDSKSYDLCLNSSILGIEDSVEVLLNYIKTFSSK